MAGELGSSGWAAELATREEREERLADAARSGALAQCESYCRAQGCTGAEAREGGILMALELGADRIGGRARYGGRELARLARGALAEIRA